MCTWNMRSNTAFERTVTHRGPRLARQFGLCAAAQLGVVSTTVVHGLAAVG
jgi:hypothetical protein